MDLEHSRWDESSALGVLEIDLLYRDLPFYDLLKSQPP